MDDRYREIQEGYLALRHNPFWLWLEQEMESKQKYFTAELLNAKTWEESCRSQGGLTVITGLWNQIRQIAGTAWKEGEWE